MNIAINGYGRMGRLIRQRAIEKGMDIPVVIDPFVQLPEVTHKELRCNILDDVDVVIDFSIPSSALHNIHLYAQAGKQAVIGTTGWYDHLDEIEKLVIDSGIGLLWSGNFSLGVQVLFHVLRYTGRIMNKLPDYDCFIHEFHHSGKADSPSGTAEMLGSILLGESQRKKSITSETLHRQIEPEELHVTSTRGGSIPGTHTIFFDSDADTIELTHRARNREGFALGAVKAAEWIYGKKGFFTIDSMMESLIAE